MENLPKVGDIVTIKTKHQSNVLSKDWDINVFENVPVVAHNYPHTISVQVDIHYPGFIFRVSEITLKNITELQIVHSKNPNWKPGKKVQLPKEYLKEVILVKGSTGNMYTVILQNGAATSCTCPGFHFRKHCRHLAEAEQIHKNEAPATVPRRSRKNA